MKKIALALIAMMFVTVACDKDNKDNVNDQTEGNTESPITIDGNFDDWGKLGNAVIAKNSTGSIWTAVKELRVYATGEYVYYYIRFDKESIMDCLAGNDIFPARVNLNTDGEFTSGYASYFLQAYDFIIEMSLGNGAGGWGTAENSTLYQRLDGSWKELLGENSGLTFGAGADYSYELALDRSIFNKAVAASSVPMPMGDVFQTSMRFYETSSTGSWEELSNMPNSSEGYGNLLEVTFAE